jgi:hypothetical protein
MHREVEAIEYGRVQRAFGVGLAKGFAVDHRI